MKKSSWEQSLPPLAWKQSPPPSEEHRTVDTQAESSGSEQEQDPDISFHPAIPLPSVPTMFMPYIEGPKMNWTVDDRLYHRFLKWQLKCETILDCKLANLPAKQNCQKVLAWSGDLEWISMSLGAYPKRAHITCHLGQIQRILKTSNK